MKDLDTHFSTNFSNEGKFGKIDANVASGILSKPRNSSEVSLSPSLPMFSIVCLFTPVSTLSSATDGGLRKY